MQDKIIEYQKECNKWEALCLLSCRTTEEQGIVKDVFTNLRDRNYNAFRPNTESETE